MNWLNKVLSTIAPATALKREVTMRRLERLDAIYKNNDKKNRQKRSFEAISGSRFRSDILSTDKSADAHLNQQNIGSLRHQIRQMEYNDGFMAGPIDRIVNNVVGSGIKFQARVSSDTETYQGSPPITDEMAKRWNYETEKYFSLWAEKADSRLILDLFEIQRTIQAALERDGEVLVIGRQSQRNNRIIPYCQQILEIDRLQTPMAEISNPQVRNGIRFDDEGVPEAYYIMRYHPGDSLSGTSYVKNDDVDEIPAFFENGLKRVLYIYNPRRPEQTRGYSKFAAGLKAYQDLSRYEEAYIMKALEDACLVGIVTTPAAEEFQQNYTAGNLSTEDGSERLQRYHEFAPGKWNYLDPGEDITIHNPNMDNSALEAFTDHLLRDPASAIDVPPEVLTQNWKGMNYSNARTVLLQFYLSCMIRQARLIKSYCIPTYHNVITQLVGRGLVTQTGFDRRTEDYLKHTWIPPGWSWVDPVKEAQGKQIELDNNIETLTNICASKGRDLEEHLESRARELQLMQEKEEKYGVKFPSKNQSTETNQPEMDEDEPEVEPDENTSKIRQLRS